MEIDSSGRYDGITIDTSDPTSLGVTLPGKDPDGSVNKLDIFGLCSDAVFMPDQNSYGECIDRMQMNPVIDASTDINQLDGVGETKGDYTNRFPVENCSPDNPDRCVILENVLSGDDFARIPINVFTQAVEAHTSTQAVKPLGIELTSGWILATGLIIAPFIIGHILNKKSSNKVNRWFEDRRRRSVNYQQGMALKEQAEIAARQAEEMLNKR